MKWQTLFKFKRRDLNLIWPTIKKPEKQEHNFSFTWPSASLYLDVPGEAHYEDVKYSIV